MFLCIIFKHCFHSLNRIFLNCTYYFTCYIASIEFFYVFHFQSLAVVDEDGDNVSLAMDDEVDNEKNEEDTVPVLHQMSRYGARKLGNFLDLPPDEVHS